MLHGSHQMFFIMSVRIILALAWYSEVVNVNIL